MVCRKMIRLEMGKTWLLSIVTAFREMFSRGPSREFLLLSRKEKNYLVTRQSVFSCDNGRVSLRFKTQKGQAWQLYPFLAHIKGHYPMTAYIPKLTQDNNPKQIDPVLISLQAHSWAAWCRVEYLGNLRRRSSVYSCSFDLYKEYEQAQEDYGQADLAVQDHLVKSL